MSFFELFKADQFLKHEFEVMSSQFGIEKCKKHGNSLIIYKFINNPDKQNTLWLVPLQHWHHSNNSNIANLNLTKTHWSIITGPVLPPIPPPFVDFRTIKLRLPQLNVNFIVGATQPLTQLFIAARGRRIHLDATTTTHYKTSFSPKPAPNSLSLKILGAVIARIKLREQVEKRAHVSLLAARRLVRVLGRDGVQQPPRAAAQLLLVQGAVGA